MAVLTVAQRRVVLADFMSEETVRFTGLTKTDLLAAIDAADDWCNANAVAYNLALPVLSRTNLTATQKARLLMQVIDRRYKVGA